MPLLPEVVALRRGSALLASLPSLVELLPHLLHLLLHLHDLRVLALCARWEHALQALCHLVSTRPVQILGDHVADDWSGLRECLNKFHHLFG